MKKLSYLIVLALILSLILTGCSLLSNVGQVPTTGQSGITYLTKGPSPDLVGLWHFDEEDGTIASDSSVYGNDGIVTGASWVAGQSGFGNALSFDGVDDYVNVSDINSSLDVDTITIEAWIYLETSQTGNHNIVRKGPWADRTYGLDIGTPGMNIIRGWVNQGPKGGSTALIANGGTVLETGEWYHVAMTYDGSQVRVYIDRVQDGISAGTTTGDIFDNNQSLRIGGQPLASEGRLPFEGLIDEVRIWRTALTEDQLGDITPPEVNISFPTPDGLVGWFVTSPVVGSVTVTDPSHVTAIDVTGANLSDVTGLDTTTASGTLTVSDEDINNIIATATDSVGNTGAAPGSSNTETIKIDTQKPEVTVDLPGTGVYLLNEVVSADWSAVDPTPGSGLATASSGTVLVDTSSVGAKTLIVPVGTVMDNAGNSSIEVTVDYSVIYSWAGFFRPVDNDVLNVAKAGRAIPVKFSLNGDQGLEIFEVGYPESIPIKCDGTDPVGEIEDTVTAGGSSLSYDADADQYIYVWKTDESWAGTCRQLVVILFDGTSHEANFKFK